MQSIRYKNLRVDRKIGAPPADRALLLAHGGYTPRRDFFRAGSGKVLVPPALTIWFNAPPKGVSVGTRALHLLQGYAFDPLDKASPGSLIENYSLTYNTKFDGCEATDEFDIITILPNGKAHIKDVFDVIGLYRLPYSFVYNFACRIDKLTFNDGNIRVLHVGG